MFKDHKKYRMKIIETKNEVHDNQRKKLVRRNEIIFNETKVMTIYSNNK